MFHPIKRLTSRFSRRTKIVSSIVSLLVIVPVIAWAAYAFNLGVGGQVKAGQFNYTLGTPQLFTSTDSGGLPAGQADICGGVTLNAGAKGITIAPGTGGLPGDTCKMHLPIIASTNSSSGTIAGLLLPGLPKGWTASLVTTSGADACGTNIASAATQSDVLVISVDSSGSNGVFDGTTHDLGAGAIEVSPTAQAQVTSCTVSGTA